LCPPGPDWFLLGRGSGGGQTGTPPTTRGQTMGSWGKKEASGGGNREDPKTNKKKKRARAPVFGALER